MPIARERVSLTLDDSDPTRTIFAIYNFLEANYAVKGRFKSYAKNTVKKLVENGYLTQVNSVRYRFSKSTKATKKKAVKKTKKSDKDKKEKKTKKTTKKSDKKEKKTTKKTKKTTKKSDKKEKKETKKSKPKKVKETRTAKKKSTGLEESGITKTRTAKSSTKTARGTAKPASSSSSDSVATGELIWVWQYYDGGFRNYDQAASSVVEGVYQEYLTSPYTTDVRSIQSGQWSYLVDFKQMTQQNVQHEAHTTRRIRRVQVPASEATDRNKNYGGDQ